MRSTLERQATQEETNLATRIVYAVRAATVAGRPLVGQPAVARAAGIGGTPQFQRRKVSRVVWLCYKLAPTLYPDMVFNRNSRLVYTVGTPILYDQLWNAYTCIHAAYTKLDNAVYGLLATHDPDANAVAVMANSMCGVAKANETTLLDILSRHNLVP